MNGTRRVWSWLAVAVLVGGCGDTNPNADTVADSDSVADSVADAVAGADTDTDTDTLRLHPSQGEGLRSGQAGTAAAATQPSTLHFTDVTGESGLAVTMTAGAVEPSQILEVKGGGLALIDLDGDGDHDVVVPNGATLGAPHAGPGARCFVNESSATTGMRFRDVTATCGLDFRGWGMGAAVADVNGDGFEDLFITAYGPNALYLGDGAGGFRNVTAAAGVAGADDAWSTGSAFGDLDGDGDLDLVVVNYLAFDAAAPPARSTFRGIPVLAGPRGLAPQRDVVYENIGDARFVDATDRWGFTAAPAYGLGALILDFDHDGDLDVYVGNDSMPNAYYVNDPGATPRFTDRAQRLGFAANADGSPQATMGMAVADISGNGFPDCFSTNFASDTNTLHVNLEGTYFDDATRRRGLGMVSYPFVGWACAFVDFDHDLDEDLLVVNGHTYPEATVETMNSAYRQPPLLFERDGRRFERVDDATRVGAWIDAAHVDRSAVFDDLDGDGDVDVIIAERAGPLRVLRNDADPATPWIVITADPPSALLGARVEFIAGESTQRRWIASGAGFLSVSAPIAHAALPESVSSVEVRVTWPGGAVTHLEALPVNTRTVVSPPTDPP